MTTWRRTGSLISVLNHMKILVRNSMNKMPVSVMATLATGPLWERGGGRNKLLSLWNKEAFLFPLVAGLSGWESTIPLRSVLHCRQTKGICRFWLPEELQPLRLVHPRSGLQLTETPVMSFQLFHMKFAQDVLPLCLCLNQNQLSQLGCTEHNLPPETIISRAICSVE